jgi:hypothetical protein
LIRSSQVDDKMADEPTSIWMYNPSFALAVLGSVLYGLVFIWIFYLTVIKHRAWFFTCVVIGAGIEVAGYGLRCYSIKKQADVVSRLLSILLSNSALARAGH